MIVLNFGLEPVAKGRPRMTRLGQIYTPTKTRAFEQTIQMSAIAQMKASKKQTLTGPVGVLVNFILTKPKTSKRIHPCIRPDLDNFLKAIMDSLNRIAWKDDAQICEIVVTKAYAIAGVTSCGTHLEIREMT